MPASSATTRTGSFWVPLLAGFVIGNAIGDVDLDVDGRRRRRYAPLYRSTSGTWYHGGSSYGPLVAPGQRLRLQPGRVRPAGKRAAHLQPQRRGVARRLRRAFQQQQRLIPHSIRLLHAAPW